MSNEMMREDMKAEIFSTRDAAKLQFQMNKFLKENPDLEIVELKYGHVCDHNGEELFSALLIYK
ncbi:MAG: hypothetical protein CME70_14685 [Halobacteriovorax sp.]|nr:hypothetical protein [Halobacteriovorax sp.]|tara:strand:- start:192510 stop:192701 length:192 start_codon:yes stop_codon:yes gene_type:complete